MGYNGIYTGAQVEEKLGKVSTLEADVEKLASATYKNKGYYKTLDHLTANVPTAETGCIAYVGVTYPFDIYEWTESGWVATGGTGGDVAINLENYYTKDEVAAMFVQSISIRELNTSYSPDTLEEMKEAGTLEENVFYFGFEEE